MKPHKCPTCGGSGIIMPTLKTVRCKACDEPFQTADDEKYCRNCIDKIGTENIEHLEKRFKVPTK